MLHTSNTLTNTVSLPLSKIIDVDGFLSRFGLNDEQKDFCKEQNRKIRLLAPAGSGKTDSLLYRCLTQQYIHNENGTPQRFLIFTFTKPAQEELENRSKLPEFESVRDAVEITTLNAWGFGIVKSKNKYVELINDSKKGTGCFQYDLKDIWTKYLPIRLAMTESKLKFSAAKEFMVLIDEFKSLGYRHDIHFDRTQFLDHSEWLCDNGMVQNLLNILDTLNRHGIISEDFEFPTSFIETYENFFGFWCEAVKKLYESGKITYEDQKYWALIELEKQIKSGGKNSLRGFESQTESMLFDHIMVDEFQDINVLDLKLLKVIAGVNNSSLCIVGDDDQSIYVWRGATQEFLLSPDIHIAKGYEKLPLNINYRSPENIVDISQKLIKHNKNRIDKDITAHKNEGAEIILKTLPEISDSIEYVTGEVKKLLKVWELRKLQNSQKSEDDKKFKIAIISRKRSQLIPYQIVFASEEIPFYAAKDLRIFESKAFETLLHFIKYKILAEIEYEHPAKICEMIVEFCSSIKKFPLSNQERENLSSYLLTKNPRTLFQALSYLYEYRGPLKGDNEYGLLAISFYEKIKEFLNAESVASSIKIANRNFEGLQRDFGKSQDDIFYTDPPFLYLSDFAARYSGDFDSFLKDVETAISRLKGKTCSEDESVELMTALRTKGRGFDVVIILDCNQNIYPIKHAETVDEIEAERRLFYVAVTRVKKKLYFIVNENMLGQTAIPSQFLREMKIEEFLT